MSVIYPPAPPPNLLFRLVPAIHALRGYTFASARADFLAGITVAAVAVPQAMAYAMIIGLPPEYGLYTAIIMTIAGALFDSSRQLINGPTNAISIAVLSSVSVLAAPENLLTVVVLLTFMVGIVQLGITLCRLGDLTRYISNSVIVGFTLGAGSILVFDQMKNLLGMKAVGDVHAHVLYRFWLSMTEGGGIQVETASVGIGTMALILLLRWIKKRLGITLLPELFIVVCIMSALSAVLGLEAKGVRVVGVIPAALPSFSMPHFDASLMRELSTGALAIALLGLLEAISMAKAISAKTKQKLDMNQQCLSEAVANLAGSFFQCIPGSGSLTRSAINQQAGAVTQWAGVISAIGVAVIVLVLAPYLRYLPRSALAGILLVVSYGMVNWHALRYHLRATQFDAAIVIATAICALAISIEFCVLLGVMLSFMLTVPRAGRMLLTEFVVSTEHGHVHQRLREDPGCERILIYGLEGELFFGASAALERHFETIQAAVTDNTRVLVLRLKRARNPDAVALSLLEHFVDHMKEHNVHVLMCGVVPHLYNVLERTGMIDRFGEQVFREQPVRQSSTMRAVQHAYTLIDEPCPICPRAAA
ncbi:MAG TPA: SulP family inorganic anion transporter [Halioglobus sp.]